VADNPAGQIARDLNHCVSAILMVAKDDRVAFVMLTRGVAKGCLEFSGSMFDSYDLSTYRRAIHMNVKWRHENRDPLGRRAANFRQWSFTDFADSPIGRGYDNIAGDLRMTLRITKECADRERYQQERHADPQESYN
jgi:hypothetical protein